MGREEVWLDREQGGLPKPPPANGEDAMHTSAEDCEDDGGEGEQKQAAHLAAAFDLFRQGSFFAGSIGLWDGLSVF